MSIVALVGRPNVGKSALFNRLTETRRAIVDDYEGVTRDRLYEPTDWNGQSFTLVDTGGIWEDERDSLLTMTRVQTERALEEADVLVLVVDGLAGMTTADEDVAKILRHTQKPVLVAVNKAESKHADIADFYRLGLGQPHPVSAMHGEGIGDLLDAIVEHLPGQNPVSEGGVSPVRIAIVGRPNVGKSSLLNWFTGEERTLVTAMAGTTRDVVDAAVRHGGQAYLFLDTAGLRRPNRIGEKLEAKTVQRSLQAMREADVVLLVLSADEGIHAQDQRIAGLIESQHKATVILLNKADLVRGTTLPLQERVREQLRFLSYASLISTSLTTKWHLHDLWSEIDHAYASYTKRIPTHHINRVIEQAIHLNPAPTHKGRQLKVYYATQVAVRPPHLVLFVNDPELVHFSYQRYLENRVREAFDFQGSPVRLSFRPRSRDIVKR
ncbi:MAG: ribosome biogenesis GTPase Der [Sulfobacillus acidophilus]|uniref:GTPase Der n=1 Tax=Sulfobacillus acidophilus TaxID=53633 RepID=A0A2T2WHQ4_9FIRM|nr:MAG: ribosome biogenesis GTPase Der [Sulfobacillus acidophilus]